MVNYESRKSRKIEHTIFKNISEVYKYYKNHPLTNALGSPGKNWSVLRVEYSDAQYDGFYVFTALNNNTKIEIDMPRAVIAIRNCSESERKDIDGFFTEPQPDGPEVVRYQSHVMCATYKEVQQHFNDSPENTPEIEMKILRVEFEDEPPHTDYENCYAFFAIDMNNGREMEIPRALLPKGKCSKKDKKEIEKIDVYLHKSGSDDSYSKEYEDFDETEDMPVVTQDKPDPKKSIN